MAGETAPPQTDNEALNSIVAELEELTSLVAEDYSSVVGDGAFVTLTAPNVRIRGSNARAVKTVITNKGPKAVDVRENGVYILTVPAGNTVEQGTLPLSGSGALKITVAGSSGEIAAIALATYQRATA